MINDALRVAACNVISLVPEESERSANLQINVVYNITERKTIEVSKYLKRNYSVSDDEISTVCDRNQREG